MIEPEPRFPAYGCGGDQVAARRARRAFRLCVAALVVLTCVLWIVERFLRYDMAEMLYLAALTHDPQSARVLLRKAVAYDEANREFPTPKYIEALAEREEKDKILPAFERAHQLDPGNAGFGIRYGCRLFLSGDFTQARTILAEASSNAPRNALPMYLEAAVVPWLREKPKESAALRSGAELASSLALVARTNGTGLKAVFPKPLWHPDLPQRGAWYAGLRRSIVDECCAPLYQYNDFVSTNAEAQIAKGQTQHWNSWLQTFDVMGRVISESALFMQDPPVLVPSIGSDDKGDSHALPTTGERGVPRSPQHAAGGDLLPDSGPVPGSALQAMAGITIQASAVKLRQKIHEAETGNSDPVLSEQSAKLETALTTLRDFENGRDRRIAEDGAQLKEPWSLLGKSICVLAACCLLASIAGVALRAGTTARTIEHSSLGKRALGAGGAVVLALLVLDSIAQQWVGDPSLWLQAVKAAWWAALVVWAGFGLVYPVLMLASPHEATRTASGSNAQGQGSPHGESSPVESGETPPPANRGESPRNAPDLPASARRCYRAAYVVLVRRYWGSALGLLLCAACVWVIGYRVFTALYPWQLELLTTGLAREETEVVRHVLSLLH